MPNPLVGMPPPAVAQGATAQVPPTQPSAAGPAAPGDAPQKQVTYQQVKEVIHKQTRIDGLLRGLLADGGKNISRKQVMDMGVTLVAERVMSPQEVAGYLTDMPDDPVQLRNWVAKHAASAERGMDQLLSMIDGQMNPDALGAQPADALGTVPAGSTPQQ